MREDANGKSTGLEVRCAFLTDDWAYDEAINQWVPNGSPFYRSYLPMTLIPRAVMGRPRFNPKDGFGLNDGTEHGRYGFDTVSLKLVMEKWVLKQIEMARKAGQRVHIDVDDFYDGLHEDNAAFNATDAANAVRNREVYRASIEMADVVTVTTPFLLDYYSDKCPDVRLIRNGVNPEMFIQRPVTKAKPVIGWMGATAWRSGDLETLSTWLPGLLDEHDLTFHHSGWHPSSPLAADRIGIDHERCSIHKMIPVTRLTSLMCFDIGLVPLNDIPFNHAKSALKGLEYAAAGIPFVAQELPEYVMLAESGVGVTAGTDAEWIEQVTRLLDPQERANDAARNCEALLDQWDYRTFRPDWWAALMPSIAAV